MTTAGSYLSVEDKRLHSGLGGSTVVKLLEVDWPSGVQTLSNVKADQILVVHENAL